MTPDLPAQIAAVEREIAMNRPSAELRAAGGDPRRIAELEAFEAALATLRAVPALVDAARALVRHDEAADWREGLPPCQELRDLSAALVAFAWPQDAKEPSDAR